MFCRLVFGVVALLATTTINGNVLPQMQKDVIPRINQQAIKEIDNGPSSSSSSLSLSSSSSSSFPSSARSSRLPPSQHYYPVYPQYDEPAQYRIQTRPENYVLATDTTAAAIQSPHNQGFSSGWSSTIASNIVPLGSFALTYGTRAAILVFQFIILLVIGVILTTSICTFSPFCSITFDGFGITNNQVREQVQELARAYITPENLNVATMLVKTAVETYGKMQQQAGEETSLGADNIITPVRERTSEKRRRRRR